MAKRIYVGVDQTGAVNRKGQPFPLPACSIDNNTVTFFYLNDFSKKSLAEKVPIRSESEVVVCVDCVLGLPQGLNITWREALEKIQLSQGYGRPVAQSFFHSLGKGRVLQRQVEIECGANSVFKEKPFQKNIQTGTYRIWKDISLSQGDFYVPHLGESEKNGKICIFEGYPSLSWRLLFGTKSRVPDQLSELVEKHFPKLNVSSSSLAMVKKDPNLGDAFVLAMTLKTQPWSFRGKYDFGNEGWILGHGAQEEIHYE